MVRNYFAAALRNLARNKLCAGINIVGLAVGLAAALLIGLYIRQELSYDRWVPHHEAIVRISGIATFGAEAQDSLNAVPFVVAPLLREEFPAVRAAARMTGATALLRHGEVEGEEKFVWTDPSLFDVLALPPVAGNPATALETPDTVILTQRLARKFFGREDVVGETIEVGPGRPMRIAAILRDLPPDTHLSVDVMASGRSRFSPLARWDASPPVLPPVVLTYVRLSSVEAIDELRRFLPEFVRRHGEFGSRDVSWTLIATPLAALHLAPPTPNRISPDALRPPGNSMVLSQLGVIGVLALLVAAINFVTLTTARSGRRAMQVGVRKALGAERRDLVAQFIGEALLEVGLALLLAVALVEIALPSLSAFLLATIRFDHLLDPALAASIIAMGVLLAVVAGLYPAWVLSSFRPVSVLRGVTVAPPGSAALRQVLVALQFAITIALVVATATIYWQVSFALNEGLRLDTDQVLLVSTRFGACDGVARDEVAALPGVQAAACALWVLNEGAPVAAKGPDGRERSANPGWVGIGHFELYGLQPVAGRFFDDRDADRAGDSARQPPIVINEAALRNFGFASAAAAVGQPLSWRRPLSISYDRLSDFVPSEIIGVVPDFPRGTVAAPVGPAIFWVDPQFFTTLSVKLTGRQIPETLAAIDTALKRVSGEPARRIFFDQAAQDLYLDVLRQGHLFAVFAAIAIFVGSLGLFGLSAFTAERRTKEIGIRKAMGAKSADIIRLLLWDFAKPVLWANLIAWPAAYYVMDRWLSGFAYHIDLEPWMFLAAGALALSIALATVAGHSVLVARAKPVTALRYE